MVCFGDVLAYTEGIQAGTADNSGRMDRRHLLVSNGSGRTLSTDVLGGTLMGMAT